MFACLGQRGESLNIKHDILLFLENIAGPFVERLIWIDKKKLGTKVGSDQENNLVWEVDERHAGGGGGGCALVFKTVDLT